MKVLVITLLVALLGSVSAHLRRLAGEVESFAMGHLVFDSQEAFIATGNRCKTPEPTAEEMAKVESDIATLPQTNYIYALVDDMPLIMVDVYFNILTSTSGEGDVSDAMIKSQMTVLNQTYQAQKIGFRLKGTTRSANNNWYTAFGGQYEGEYKTALRKGTYASLNIYTSVQNTGILGWATMPGNMGQNYKQDGVVVDYRTLPGGSYAPYNLGKTITHEAGHWFGLYHTWNGGCVENVNKGDMVADTPAEANYHFGCPAATTNSCPGTTGGLAGNDPVDNYMEYVNDACMTKFTVGQRTRMRQLWDLYRNNK